MFAGASAALSAPCPPQGVPAAKLRQLSKHGWQILNAERRDQLAIALTACLRNPDSELRDKLAFSGLQTWFRGGSLTKTMRQISHVLERRLAEPDPSGFARPFAALALAEVVRADRMAPFLSDREHQELSRAACDYLPSISDYRGFDDHDGWRHGVAHGADFVLQLALNPAITDDQIRCLRKALQTQIAPRDHRYVYGEPQRLALPIVYMARRPSFSAADWETWIDSVASPAPLNSWNDAFNHNYDLARLHNTRAFLAELYLAANLTGGRPRDMLAPPLGRILSRMPS